jgi:hypothetical protein
MMEGGHPGEAGAGCRGKPFGFFPGAAICRLRKGLAWEDETESGSPLGNERVTYVEADSYRIANPVRAEHPQKSPAFAGLSRCSVAYLP